MRIMTAPLDNLSSFLLKSFNELLLPIIFEKNKIFAGVSSLSPWLDITQVLDEVFDVLMNK